MSIEQIALSGLGVVVLCAIMMAVCLELRSEKLTAEHKVGRLTDWIGGLFTPSCLRRKRHFLGTAGNVDVYRVEWKYEKS